MFFVLIENEVLNVRVVGEQKSSELMSKMGDFCLGLGLAVLAAVFAEYVLKGEANIDVFRAMFCVLFALLMVGSSIVCYKKGGK